jgi:transposase
MEHYAGLDVSIKETSVCVIDDTGRVVREVKVPTEPEAILAILADEDFSIKRIGLEAGPLSQWLYGELAEAGLPMICVETRHMRAVLSAQINKSDRNDARGIAHMMRVGLYRPVHVKTLASQTRRMLLTSRQLRRLPQSYARNYNQSRTHRALNKDAPLHRAIESIGAIISRPVLMGFTQYLSERKLRDSAAHGDAREMSQGAACAMLSRWGAQCAGAGSSAARV